MRNWIIGAAALLAVAAPGVAAAQTGYVGATYGNIDVDGAGDADFYGVEGAVAFAGSGSIVFEVDASITDSDDLEEAYGLTGHLYSRNDSYLFGGFVGIGSSDDSETWTAGLEASKFFTDWTLAGALYFASNDDADTDVYGINAQGRFFIHDNFRLQGNFGWANVDVGGVGEDDGFTYGVGAEYQFAAAPISIGASYNIIDSDSAEADVIAAVLRYNFGGTTLRDRDRNGASQADITGVGFLF